MLALGQPEHRRLASSRQSQVGVPPERDRHRAVGRRPDRRRDPKAPVGELDIEDKLVGKGERPQEIDPGAVVEADPSR